MKGAQMIGILREHGPVKRLGGRYRPCLWSEEGLLDVRARRGPPASPVESSSIPCDQCFVRRLVDILSTREQGSPRQPDRGFVRRTPVSLFLKCSRRRPRPRRRKDVGVQ